MFGSFRTALLGAASSDADDIVPGLLEAGSNAAV